MEHRSPARNLEMCSDCVVSTGGQKAARPDCVAKLLSSFEMNPFSIGPIWVPWPRYSHLSHKKFKCVQMRRAWSILWWLPLWKLCWNLETLRQSLQNQVHQTTMEKHPLRELDEHTTSTDQEHIYPPLRNSCRFPQKACSVKFCPKPHVWVQTMSWRIRKAFIDKICGKWRENWTDFVHLERGFEEGLEFLLPSFLAVLLFLKNLRAEKQQKT